MEAPHILQGPGEAAKRIRSERASASRQASQRASQQAAGHEQEASINKRLMWAQSSWATGGTSRKSSSNPRIEFDP